MTQDEALEILKSGANVFLTGEPGSGKSHTINNYVEWCARDGRKVAITAATGIASIQISGVTLHSWGAIGTRSRLLPGEARSIVSGFAGDRIRSAHTLVVDEVSMVSGAVLNMVNEVCRAARAADEPFGGLQVILVGDFFQLPPVIRRDVGDRDAIKKGESPFAFNSLAWKELDLTVCYLNEQHRQDDPEYLRLLAAIRGDYCKFYDPALRKRHIRDGCIPSDVSRLYTHNVDVDAINTFELEKLPGAARLFEMKCSGPDFFITALKKGGSVTRRRGNRLC